MNYQLAMYPDLVEAQALDDPLLLELPPSKKKRGKPKQNQKGDATESKTYDRCQTPPWAFWPLLPYLTNFGHVWECACGEGMLADAIEEQGFRTTRTDILTGDSFFSFLRPPVGCDALITNPPYSIKYLWLEHCFALGLPFALLVPGETILSGKAINLYKKYGRFGKPEFLALDQRISFKMPNKGWEWIDEEGKKKKSSAQFPVLWLCHNVIPSGYEIGHVLRPKERNQMVLNLC